MSNIVFFLEQSVAILASELNKKACSGTIYSTLLLAKELSTNDEYRVYICHKGDDGIRDGIVYLNYSNYDNLNIKLKLHNIHIDYFIVSGNEFKVFDYLDQTLNINEKIFWLHNHINLNDVKRMVCEDKISKIVTVSAYQMGWTIKYGLFSKTRYIYNPYMSIDRQLKVKSSNDRLKLCFIGALVPEKGIFNLLRVFNDISNSGIDVSLDIFGSSSLYGDSVTLGTTNALSEKLEKEYSELIFDTDGNIKNGLKFYGAQPKEIIIDNICCCDVFLSGLNETGPAECFSISFLDAQSVGVPVYTLRRGGQAETILSPSSGKVFNNIKELTSTLINDFKLKDIQVVDNSCLSKVSPLVICDEWKDLFIGKKTTINKKIRSLVLTMSVLTSLLFNGYLKK